MGENETTWVPVTFDRCDHIEGPFHHGTRSTLEMGDELVPGHGSTFHEGHASNNIYCYALLEPAVWGAKHI